MEIRIDDRQAQIIWNQIKSHPRKDNTDEQFTGNPDNEVYRLFYDFDNLVIVAYFTILDGAADMDSLEFVNWNEPDALYIVSDGIIEG